jgi:hypothetical protein
MHDLVLSSGRDAFLIAIPSIPLLLLYVFRLDQVIAAPKRAPLRSRLPYAFNRHDQPVLTDPDGRVVVERRRKS